MGRISFSLYLFHEVFTDWAMVDTYYYLLDKGVNPDLAISQAFLIYTPPLFLVSWLLTKMVDNPAKDFAYEVDIQSRKERPPPPKGTEKEATADYYSTWNFAKRSWAIFGFAGWLVCVYLFTEIYQMQFGKQPILAQDVTQLSDVKQTLAYINEMKAMGKWNR